MAGEDPDHQGPPAVSHELLAFDIASESCAVSRMVWVWAVARQIMLLYEFDRSVMGYTMLGNEAADDAALAASLVAGARIAVGRLSLGGDQTSRVLGGGVENRWRGRLANVQDFLAANKRFDRLANTLLQVAGVSEAELRRLVAELVAGSRRFDLPSASTESWQAFARPVARQDLIETKAAPKVPMEALETMAAKAGA